MFQSPGNNSSAPNNAPFLRVRAEYLTIAEVLHQLNIEASVVTDHQGLFRNTLKIYTAHGHDVPTVLKYLRNYYEKRNQVWEPLPGTQMPVVQRDQYNTFHRMEPPPTMHYNKPLVPSCPLPDDTVMKEPEEPHD